MLGCSDWEPSPCLLRFDLIFLMLDPQDEAYDRRLAHHLVSLYYQSEEEAQEEAEVIDTSPSNLNSSLCFFQSSISHDVLCI